jgi:hypothetical protein
MKFSKSITIVSAPSTMTGDCLVEIGGGMPAPRSSSAPASLPSQPAPRGPDTTLQFGGPLDRGTGYTSFPQFQYSNTGGARQGRDPNTGVTWTIRDPGHGPAPAA